MSKFDVKMTDDVKDVLTRSRYAGDSMFLPENLSRDLYVRVNKHIENCGGKWNRSKKAHTFPAGIDAMGRLLRAVESGASTNHKKKKQAFYTPECVAFEVANFISYNKGQYVLEPSIGHGNIANALVTRGVPAEFIHGVDIDPEAVEVCRKKYNVVSGDFMSIIVPPSGMRASYERIAMNPPFTGGQWHKHILHAYTHWLKPGGRLVAIVPDTNMKPLSRLEVYFPVKFNNGEFKESGTSINTVLMYVDKPNL